MGVGASVERIMPEKGEQEMGGEIVTQGGAILSRCRTCGQPVGGNRLYTDEGVFHDRESCLDAPLYEALVADGRSVQEWNDHLDEEHAVWSTEELLARERRFMDARLP